MPCGQSPLFKMSIFTMLTIMYVVRVVSLQVTAVLQRELIDGLRLFTNVLSLLLILTTGKLMHYQQQ